MVDMRFRDSSETVRRVQGPSRGTLIFYRKFGLIAGEKVVVR